MHLEVIYSWFHHSLLSLMLINCWCKRRSKREVKNFLVNLLHSSLKTDWDHFLLILGDKMGTMITRSLILFEDIARKHDIALKNVIRCMEIQLILNLLSKETFNSLLRVTLWLLVDFLEILLWLAQNQWSMRNFKHRCNWHNNADALTGQN